MSTCFGLRYNAWRTVTCIAREEQEASAGMAWHGIADHKPVLWLCRWGMHQGLAHSAPVRQTNRPFLMGLKPLCPAADGCVAKHQDNSRQEHISVGKPTKNVVNSTHSAAQIRLKACIDLLEVGTSEISACPPANALAPMCNGSTSITLDTCCPQLRCHRRAR